MEHPLETLRKAVEARFGRPFPNLRCAMCMDHALDDDDESQITDDEELDRMKRDRIKKRKDKWLKAKMYPT